MTAHWPGHPKRVIGNVYYLKLSCFAAWVTNSNKVSALESLCHGLWRVVEFENFVDIAVIIIGYFLYILTPFKS